ncbi:hypothetical protein EII29_02135 [Leptotrichia sp. OH3620_COT-345]|uniref:hypothetical protein n=1 Tax=Leptotrichia sp. OH3620_COT-345 TaxID=2491048 RepID=UPI000F653F8F|nr:hypothetical protein [Leptotrichia sp. OH3620_COT-345]RRD40755.1 hypothetical protein EII29_02135 [Leptotrichia sp. OH3620_COT-345]
MKKKSVLWLLFFMIGILLPCFTYIYGNVYKEVKTNFYELELTNEIIKGTKIKEKIYLPGYVTKFGLMFSTYLRENKGKIKISLKQNNKKIEKIIDISEIKHDQINNIEMDFSKLKKGEAIIEIEGIEGELNTSVSLYKSSDISLGIISENNLEQNKSLVYQLNYYSIDKIVIVQIIFTFLLTVSFILLIKLLEKEQKNTSKIYFLTSIIIYFLINIKVPIVTFKAEPYGEVITNFLFYGLSKNFLDNIFIPDAGYFPLFQRIIALIIIKLFKSNLKLTIFIMQNIGVYSICLMSSIFVLRNYRKYGDLLFRFCIAVILGGGVTLTSSIELYYFFNITYYGIVALFFISLLNFEKLKKNSYILLMIFVFFINISKLYFVVLFPLVLIVLIVFWKKILLKERIYLLIILISNFVQIIFTKFHSNGKGLFTTNIDYLSINLEKIIFKSVQYLIFMFIPEITLDYNVGFINILFFLLWIILIFIILFLFKKLRNKESLISIILIFVILGTILLNILSINNFFGWNSDFQWMKTTDITNMRHSVFIIISYISLSILLLYNSKLYYLKKIKISKIYRHIYIYIYKIFYMVLSFILIIRFNSFDNNQVRNQYPNSVKNKEAVSDWNKYYKFFNEEKYLIPYEPFLMISKNILVYSVKKDSIKNYPKIFSLNPNTDFFWIEKNNEQTEQLHEMTFEKKLNIEYLYTERLRANNNEKLKVIGYNEKDEIVLELEQLNKKEKQFIGFKNSGNIKVKKIKFFTLENKKAYIKSGFYIGIDKNTKENEE